MGRYHQQGRLLDRESDPTTWDKLKELAASGCIEWRSNGYIWVLNHRELDPEPLGGETPEMYIERRDQQIL